MLALVVGLLLLVAGAEALVRGASGLAAALGVSPLLVGLTVVAYGTSAPEVAVSVQSSLAGQSDIALGNVVGSNIFNVLFILGVSAAVAPLTVAWKLIRFDVPLMIAVSVVCFALAADGRLGQFDGLLLLAGGVTYSGFQIIEGRRESASAPAGAARTSPRSGWSVLDIVLVVVGLALLVIGSRWLVDGALDIARWLGVSELVIGLTIIAAGTSLPEAATSLIASLRGQRDIAVGNVVGSNVFNILFVLGLSVVVAPAEVLVAPGVLSFDLPVMIAVALACLPIFFSGGVIARWEGGLFLAYYAAYTAYLILAATRHDALPLFSATMMGFVVPLTAVTLAVLGARAAGRRLTARE
jgi:cation:H+ antiporter